MLRFNHDFSIKGEGLPVGRRWRGFNNCILSCVGLELSGTGGGGAVFVDGSDDGPDKVALLKLGLLEGDKKG
jgi:hypothetical protein